MTIKKVAVPSQSPGGLNCKRSDHFGHCKIFTIITFNGSGVIEVSTVENVPHEAEGCNEPITVLQQQNVTSLVVQGIGKRPLLGLQEAGITVLFSPLITNPTVQDVINDIQNDRLLPFEIDQTCKGHGNCHDH